MTMTNLVLRFATEIAGIAPVGINTLLLVLLGTEPRDRMASVTR